MMELAHLANILLAVNKLIINEMQNIFYLIVEYSGFMKYTINKAD